MDHNKALATAQKFLELVDEYRAIDSYEDGKGVYDEITKMRPRVERLIAEYDPGTGSRKALAPGPYIGTAGKPTPPHLLGGARSNTIRLIGAIEMAIEEEG